MSWQEADTQSPMPAAMFHLWYNTAWAPCVLQQMHHSQNTIGWKCGYWDGALEFVYSQWNSYDSLSMKRRNRTPCASLNQSYVYYSLQHAPWPWTWCALADGLHEEEPQVLFTLLIARVRAAALSSILTVIRMYGESQTGRKKKQIVAMLITDELPHKPWDNCVCISDSITSRCAGIQLWVNKMEIVWWW